MMYKNSAIKHHKEIDTKYGMSKLFGGESTSYCQITLKNDWQLLIAFPYHPGKPGRRIRASKHPKSTF